MSLGSALSAQDTIGASPIDSTFLSYQLEIVSLRVELTPNDTTTCAAMLIASDPTALLCNHFLSANSSAQADVIVKVKNASLIKKLHFKAGRSQGGSQILQSSIAYCSSSAISGCSISLVDSNTLRIRMNNCVQALPFYLEAWLEDHHGHLSSVKTYSIVP